MDVDQVLEDIGEFGAVQVRLFLLISVPTVWIALHTMIHNFIGSDPGWSCSVPPAAGDLGSSRNCSGLGAGAVGPSCGRRMVLSDVCAHHERAECVVEFSGDFTSIVSEWGLICGKSPYPSFAQSGFFVGLMIGSWLFGMLSDRYGRKKTFFVAAFGCWVCGFGYSLAVNFFMFFLFRMLFGMFSNGVIVISYTLLMEFIGKSKRSSVGIFYQVPFSLGFLILAAMANWLRDWRALTLVCTLLGTGILAMWRMIPESPRWLLLQGREEQARNVLADVARGNHRQMPNYKLRVPAVGQDSVSAANLFRGREIRRQTSILLLAWFTNCAVYYGLSLNAGSLGGGRYLSLGLSGMVELPALYVAYQLVIRCGRRWSHGGLLMLGGVSCLMWSVVHWIGMGVSIKLVLALLGKSAVAASFAVIYLYSVELFPTQVRSVGLGVVSVGSRLGGILTPLLLLLGSLSDGVPMFVMGCMGLVAGFCTLSLPETLNRPLVESLAELETTVY